MSTARNEARERKDGTTPFPGGNVTPEKGELRIAIDKKAYAEVIGHAVLEPEVEVCGVLVGRLLRDAQGEYLHIRAAIRGEAAKQEGAQVTFTHDTWNHIHQEMDARYRDEEIVGWYHTHGGFGIFLSEMDSFIHKNFFSAPHQVAYVFDPLAGSEGFFQSRDGQLVLCRRHWVGGRERKSVGRDTAAPSSSTGPESSPANDFSAVARELHRTALALQSLGQRSSDPLPLWGWLVIGLLGVATLWFFFSGTLTPGDRSSAANRPATPLLIVQRDELSGRAVGLELHVVAQQQGPVYRDEAGQLFLGVEPVGPDGKPVPLAGLLGQTPGAAAASRAGASTPHPSPLAPGSTESWLERFRTPLLIGVGVLGLLAAAFLGWRGLRGPER